MGKTGKYFRPSAAAAAAAVVSVSVGHGQLPVGETKVRVSTFTGVDGGLSMPSQPLDDVMLCSSWDLLEYVFGEGCWAAWRGGVGVLSDVAPAGPFVCLKLGRERRAPLPAQLS